MRRHPIVFSLRADATVMPFDELVSAVEEALGCFFEPGEHQRRPCLVGQLIGSKVVIDEARGPGGARTYQLEGVVDPPASDAVDLSATIQELLAEAGVGPWRVPTPGEVIAERRHASQLDRQREQDEAAWHAESRALFATMPHMAQVGVALEQHRTGQPITASCGECAGTLAVESMHALSETLVSCPAGCTRFIASQPA